jgi:ketosteroid isomerase-like protein
MSVKRIVLPLSAVLLLVLISLSAIQAAEFASPSVVDALFLELSAGDIADAAALFAEDAVLTNQLTGRSYEGIAEIEQLLAGWHHRGRIYDVVSTSTDGDTVLITVDVSDQGFIWARKQLAAEVDGGKIRSLDLVDIRLALFPMRWRDDGS